MSCGSLSSLHGTIDSNFENFRCAAAKDSRLRIVVKSHRDDILPTTLNACSLSRKVNSMRCYHLLWCIENLIVPVRYHSFSHFEYPTSQWRTRLQNVLPSTLVYRKGESASETTTHISATA